MSNDAMISFVVPGEPVGKGRPRAFRMGNGIRMYTPKKTASYESLVKMACSHSYRGAPLEGPVAMRIECYFSIPKSMKKSWMSSAEEERMPVTKKPDGDNIIKAVSDALNGIAFKDDAQVSDVACSKRYSKIPRVVVNVFSMKQFT